MTTRSGALLQKLSRMTTEDRIKLAKEKTNRVVDHVRYLLELHENNEIVLYSNTLSQQIPTSYAANAFNVFQLALRQIEIVRLCALWDRAGIDKENIPIIVEAVNDPAVIGKLVEETRSHWQHQGGEIFTESDDPQLIAAAAEAARRNDEQFGQQEATAAQDDLQAAIKRVRDILESSLLARIMNYRDKRLAHSLAQTGREKVRPIPPMRVGDEREMLNESCEIVEVCIA
jgi:hypothetical protein